MSRVRVEISNEEMIKALRHCEIGRCSGCPLRVYYDCDSEIYDYAAYAIAQQGKRIKELESELEFLKRMQSNQETN